MVGTEKNGLRIAFQVLYFIDITEDLGPPPDPRTFQVIAYI